jgi:UDP-glucose 4-epimerase
MSSQKLAVVTGGAGFIGSHLCERLQNDGWRVISLDNYFTGSKDNHVPGVEYREGHTKDIAKLVPENPDIIYHLGEYARTAVAIEEPDVVLDLNTIGTIGVLEYWRSKKCKLVYAGSSTVKADTRADGVEGRDLSPYTWTKAANTDLVRNYARWYALSYATVYFFNVYGPRERAGKYGTVVEIFRQNLEQGQPHKVNSPGTQTRTYTHVMDTVDALIVVGEKGEGDDYGICSKDTVGTLELANLFGGEIVMMPARGTSRPSTPINCSKTQLLGWTQKHFLKDYIQDCKKSL